jgi:hypothetical protein
MNNSEFDFIADAYGQFISNSNEIPPNLNPFWQLMHREIQSLRFSGILGENAGKWVASANGANNRILYFATTEKLSRTTVWNDGNSSVHVVAAAGLSIADQGQTSLNHTLEQKSGLEDLGLQNPIATSLVHPGEAVVFESQLVLVHCPDGISSHGRFLVA